MDIIELAKQAGLHIATDVNWMPIISLEYAEKFAALVAAAARADEREACAKLCEANVWSKPVAWWREATKSDVSVEAGLQCAIAIRARGTT
jgi:hypothetical protein